MHSPTRGGRGIGTVLASLLPRPSTPRVRPSNGSLGAGGVDDDRVGEDSEETAEVLPGRARVLVPAKARGNVTEPDAGVAAGDALR